MRGLFLIRSSPSGHCRQIRERASLNSIGRTTDYADDTDCFDKSRPRPSPSVSSSSARIVSRCTTGMLRLLSSPLSSRHNRLQRTLGCILIADLRLTSEQASHSANRLRQDRRPTRPGDPADLRLPNRGGLRSRAAHGPAARRTFRCRRMLFRFGRDAASDHSRRRSHHDAAAEPFLAWQAMPRGWLSCLPGEAIYDHRG